MCTRHAHVFFLRSVFASVDHFVSFCRFWNMSNPSQMLNMTDTPEFSQDSFGLKTLYDSQRLVLHSVDGVLHQGWLDRADIFTQHILPLLQLQ
jgi:hypothetical protein